MSEDRSFLESLFGLHGRVAVVTGGSGVLGSAMATGLAAAGAHVAVLGRNAERAAAVANTIEASGAEAMAVLADVTQRAAIESARDAVLDHWGRIDILINAAGGNVPAATTTETLTAFDLPIEALRQAIDLNFIGTVLPSQVFGQSLAEGGGGSIVNISSMTVGSALTRVAGYSAGKAAMENFTRWLAVDTARRYGDSLRVNAVAPGFFIAEHNRDLLTHQDGSPTSRGQTILSRTPMGRFGRPNDLVSAVIWLCGHGAQFVTGIVLPVDGGFSAFSGV
jgi:NAD(P)-dependent dehydrogenase (short-subunit alcohol dehydrogenase family)